MCFFHVADDFILYYIVVECDFQFCFQYRWLFETSMEYRKFDELLNFTFFSVIRLGARVH